MEADTRQLPYLKALLNTFADAPGQKVNCSKSSLIPININDERGEYLINTLHYKRGTFPFTYLGLPLGLAKPMIEQCLPQVNRIEKTLGSGHLHDTSQQIASA